MRRNRPSHARDDVGGGDQPGQHIKCAKLHGLHDRARIARRAEDDDRQRWDVRSHRLQDTHRTGVEQPHAEERHVEHCGSRHSDCCSGLRRGEHVKEFRLQRRVKVVLERMVLDNQNVSMFTSRHGTRTRTMVVQPYLLPSASGT